MRTYILKQLIQIVPTVLMITLVVFVMVAARLFDAERIGAVGLVAQSGITSFIAWHEDPEAQPWIAADVFATADASTTRAITCSGLPSARP